MMQDILVPMDDSGPAWNALEYTLSAYPDATFTGLHVLDPSNYHSYGGDMGVVLPAEKSIEHRRRKQAEELLAEVASVAENRDQKIQTEIEEGHPATVIVTYAEEQDIDLIVIGSHGRSGVKRLLLGSVAEAVIRRSSVPVTVVREY